MSEFEYRILDDNLTVQVRAKRMTKPRPIKQEKKGRLSEWRHYMTCDCEEQAERVLYLLQQAQQETQHA